MSGFFLRSISLRYTKETKLQTLRVMVGCLCFFLDMTSKNWARTNLPAMHSVPFFPGFLKFSLITNTGAAFNLGSGHGFLMTVIASAVTVLLIVWVLKEEKRAKVGRELVNTGAGFLIGGALGNLSDRFLRGRVTDFLEFDFIQFPVFNFADICIDIGVGLLIISAWRNKVAQKSLSSAESEVPVNSGV